MKKLVATAVALAVAGTAAFAETNGEATPSPDNKPAAQSPAPTPDNKARAPKHKHHKHHKHHKKVVKKVEKKTEKEDEKPADNQNNEQSK